MDIGFLPIGPASIPETQDESLLFAEGRITLPPLIDHFQTPSPRFEFVKLLRFYRSCRAVLHGCVSRARF